jgi:hypothetical protein
MHNYLAARAWLLARLALGLTIMAFTLSGCFQPEMALRLPLSI